MGGPAVTGHSGDAEALLRTEKSHRAHLTVLYATLAFTSLTWLIPHGHAWGDILAACWGLGAALHAALCAKATVDLRKYRAAKRLVTGARP